MDYEKIKKFTKIVLDVMFFGGIVVVVTIPFWLKWAGNHYSELIGRNYWVMLIIFGVSGLCGLGIVNELRKMMRTVLRQNCFIETNVTSLRLMAKFSIIISAFFLIKLIFVPTPATVIIVLVFFIAALFSVVLSCVFKEAIEYKNENDLTI